MPSKSRNKPTKPPAPERRVSWDNPQVSWDDPTALEPQRAAEEAPTLQYRARKKPKGTR